MVPTIQFEIEQTKITVFLKFERFIGVGPHERKVSYIYIYEYRPG
jgi:hypothetical protein